MLYRAMQPEYKPAKYLSVVRCASNRRLISRFRIGCHGLRVDTGRWADGVHLDRTDRLCLVCNSLDCVEDKQHFVFVIAGVRCSIFVVHLGKTPDRCCMSIYVERFAWLQ